MNARRAAQLWLVGAVGCGAPASPRRAVRPGPTTPSVPVAGPIATAATRPTAELPEVIWFGDHRRTRRAFDPPPATVPAPPNSPERLADAYVAAHHADWGACVLGIPAADGWHGTYGGAPRPAVTATPTTEPSDTGPSVLLPMTLHELVVRRNGTIEVTRP